METRIRVLVQVYGSIRRLQVTILMDGKWSFIRFKRGLIWSSKRGSRELRKIKIGSEWRMISTIINTESQFYEGTGKLGEYMDTALGSSRRERGKRIMEP
ncbi:hypothetical protein HID58_096228, partial [Brassica napus]